MNGTIRRGSGEWRNRQLWIGMQRLENSLCVFGSYFIVGSYFDLDRDQHGERLIFGTNSQIHIRHHERVDDYDND